VTISEAARDKLFAHPDEHWQSRISAFRGTG